MPKLSPAPPKDNSRFDDWIERLRLIVIGQDSSTETTTTQSHTALSNLNSDSYTHLTASQANGLTSQGDTSLHYHTADRARANHTGTQTASTISDFTPAVQAVVGSMDNILASQVFGG